MADRSPSSRWTVTFGFAQRASNTIRTFLRVCSDTFRLWLDERRAWPDWKKCERAPPMFATGNDDKSSAGPRGAAATSPEAVDQAPNFRRMTKLRLFPARVVKLDGSERVPVTSEVGF